MHTLSFGLHASVPASPPLYWSLLLPKPKSFIKAQNYPLFQEVFHKQPSSTLLCPQASPQPSCQFCFTRVFPPQLNGALLEATDGVFLPLQSLLLD